MGRPEDIPEWAWEMARSFVGAPTVEGFGERPEDPKEAEGYDRAVKHSLGNTERYRKVLLKEAEAIARALAAAEQRGREAERSDCAFEARIAIIAMTGNTHIADTVAAALRRENPNA